MHGAKHTGTALKKAKSANSRPGPFPSDLDLQIQSSTSCSLLPRTLPTLAYGKLSSTGSGAKRLEQPNACQ